MNQNEPGNNPIDEPILTGLTENMELYVNWIWRNLPDLTYKGSYTIHKDNIEWTSTDTSVAKIIDNDIYTYKEGTTYILGSYNNETDSMKLNVKSAPRDPEYVTVVDFLATPSDSAIFTIPIVIISFLPTADNVNLDCSYSPDYYNWNPLTLENLETRIFEYNIRMKYALEQGSRFRVYNNPSAKSSLGYRVLSYINVYEPIPPGKKLEYYEEGKSWDVDYYQICQRFNIQDYVENQGVKEVWLWWGGLSPTWPSFYPSLNTPEKYRGGAESNMSSPITGDISNSTRIHDDLPIYDKTYIVYNHNFRRTQTINMEPHTHQFEHMLMHINRIQDGDIDLFWNKFVGHDLDGNPIKGRCGWTHTPPNTTINYGYFHYIQVDIPPYPCDIEDWTPDNSGAKKMIDRHSWEDTTYNWPDGKSEFIDRFELQWFMYWMQSFPGYENQITYGTSKMTNWWSIIAKWDSVIANDVGLYGN